MAKQSLVGIAPHDCHFERPAQLSVSVHTRPIADCTVPTELHQGIGHSERSNYNRTLLGSASEDIEYRHQIE